MGAAISVLPAKAVDLQPGLWEVSAKRERAGVAIQRPMRTKCVTPERAKQISAQTLPVTDFKIGARNCKMIDLKTTDKELTWRMECPGVLPAEQAGRFVADTLQHYTSEIRTSVNLPGKTLSSVLITEGRRIGECSP